MVQDHKDIGASAGCSQKKYTSLKANFLAAGKGSLVKSALFVRQDFNLNFDTSLVKIGKKFTEL